MIDVALKEWSIVCDLLVEGELALLLRKGGIHEDEGPGEFRLRHDRFALFPAWEHQKPEMIKPPLRDRVRVLEEPAEVTIRGWAEVGRIWQVPSRPALEQLDDLHCWTPAHLDMRFNYKPDHPLYLVAVRAHRLPELKTVVNDWSYGGCKSWVPLKEHDAIDEAASEPAMSDEAFERITRRVERTFSAAEESSEGLTP